MDGSFVASHAAQVATIPVDQEAVLLDEAADRLHLLNPTGALLWACFDGTTTLGEICSEVADAFALPAEIVLADAIALATRLLGEGLLADGRPRLDPTPPAPGPELARAAPVALEEPPNP